MHTRNSPDDTTSESDLVRYVDEINALLDQGCDAASKKKYSAALSHYRVANSLASTYVAKARRDQENGLNDPMWRENYAGLEYTYGITITEAWNLLLKKSNTPSEYKEAQERYTVDLGCVESAFSKAENTYIDIGSSDDVRFMRSFRKQINTKKLPALRKLLGIVDEEKKADVEEKKEEAKLDKKSSSAVGSTATLKKLMETPSTLAAAPQAMKKRKEHSRQMPEERPKKQASSNRSSSHSAETNEQSQREIAALRQEILREKARADAAEQKVSGLTYVLLQTRYRLKVETKKSEGLKNALQDSQLRLETAKTELETELMSGWKSLPALDPAFDVLLSADASSLPADDRNAVDRDRKGYRP